MVQYSIRMSEATGFIITLSNADNLQQLLIYDVLRRTQPPTFNGTENKYIRDEGLVWLDGTVVCLWPHCPLARGLDGRKCDVIPN